MSIIPKLIYKLNTITISYPQFVDINRQCVSKIDMKHKEIEIVETILKKALEDLHYSTSGLTNARLMKTRYATDIRISK